MMLFIWSTIGVVMILAFLFVRFRPFLSLAIGFAAAGIASSRFPILFQAAALIVAAVVAELLLKLLWQKVHRPHTDPGALMIVGASGKIRDIVHARKEIFLLHCDGNDWIARPEIAGSIQLGDVVVVVRAEGKLLRVRRNL